MGLENIEELKDFISRNNGVLIYGHNDNIPYQLEEFEHNKYFIYQNIGTFHYRRVYI